MKECNVCFNEDKISKKLKRVFEQIQFFSRRLCEVFDCNIHLRSSSSFIKTYINQVLHFETTMSFRSEIEHAQLKRHLRASTDDLKTMINSINLMLKNQIHNHLIA